MNNIELLFQTLGIISSISGREYSLDDLFIGSNPKIIDYSNKLLFEILDLLEDGYSEEDIIRLINECEFNGINDLNDEEKEYLKKDAKKTLKKIVNNRKGEWYIWVKL